MTRNILDLKADRTPVADPVRSEPEAAGYAREAEELESADNPSESESVDTAVLLAEADVPEELSWDARAPYPASSGARRWYLTWGLIGAGVLTAYLQASWSTGLVVLAGVAAWKLHERHTAPSKVHIGSRGCTIDGHHIPHARLTSFDLHELRDGSVHLSLQTNARLASRIHIPLGDQDPGEVHAILSRFVPEANHPVPFWEGWMRKN